MIIKTCVLTIIFTIGLLRGVTGASYSNVYVERDIAPRGYYRYAPYTSLADPRISQITSLPAITEYGAPCGSPCIFPAPVVAPVNPSPNVITYNAPIPSVPVLVTQPKEAANGYEYSYAVYDESTGDHKAQRELSDGSVVRGEYSFIQPDGYVREVQYVADDISGFNAIVKNFLPATVESKKKVESVVKTESTPPLTFDCHEIKSESIKQDSNENSEAITEQLLKTHENLHKEQSKEESAENTKEIQNHSSEENSKEKKHSKEESGEETEDKSKEVHDIKPEPSKEQSSEVSEEKSKENLQLEPKHSKEESSEKSKEEKSHSKESGQKSEEETKPASNESGEESVSKESKEELKEKSKKKATIHSGEKSSEKNKNNSKKESSEEDSGEEINHGKHKETFELLKPPQEAVVPYHDIVRCIQAAMRRSYGVPTAINEDHSPLTYIVLNKPC